MTHSIGKNGACIRCGLPEQFTVKYPECCIHEKGKWIEFKEHKPPTGSVLVVMKDSAFWSIPLIGEYDPKGWGFKDKRKWRIVDLWGWDMMDRSVYQFVDGEVTHWMPLPKMPE